MVDMLYLSYTLTKREYNNAFSSLQSYLKKNFSKGQLRKDKFDKRAYITNAFSEYGLQEIRLRTTPYGYYIEIRLRPKLTIYRSEIGYYSVTKVSEFVEVRNVFNYILKDIISLDVPDFFDWKAKRIEAAVDLKLSEELIPKYITLFKKGNLPDYFSGNSNTQKYISSDTNVYYMSKNKTVNWYNRYETLLIKEEESGKKYRDFRLTKGLLRFETQVRDGKEIVREILNQQRLKNEVMKFYKLIVGKGDYYSFNKAEQILKASIQNAQKCKKLLNFLKLIESCGGITRAKKVYIGNDIANANTKAKASADKFGKLLKKLRDQHINPVLIPAEWGIDYMENPYNKIEEEFEK